MAAVPPAGPGILGGGGSAPAPAAAPGTPGTALLAALRARPGPAAGAPILTTPATPAAGLAAPPGGALTSPAGLATPAPAPAPPAAPAPAYKAPILRQPDPTLQRRVLARGAIDRDTWINMRQPERDSYIDLKFSMNTYFEYHRRGHSLLHDQADPDAPWNRAIRDPTSHWAVYQKDNLQNTQRLTDLWGAMYIMEPDDPRLTREQRRDIRARNPRWQLFQIDEKIWDPARNYANEERDIQDMINIGRLPIQLERVFRAGGQVSCCLALPLYFAFSLSSFCLSFSFLSLSRLSDLLPGDEGSAS